MSKFTGTYAYGRAGTFEISDTQLKQDSKDRQEEKRRAKKAKFANFKRSQKMKRETHKCRWHEQGEGKHFYVVFRGSRPGIFIHLEDAKASIQGYPHPTYSGFPSLEQAQDWFLSQHDKVKRAGGKYPSGVPEFRNDIRRMRKFMKRAEDEYNDK